MVLRLVSQISVLVALQHGIIANDFILQITFLEAHQLWYYTYCARHADQRLEDFQYDIIVNDFISEINILGTHQPWYYA